MSINSYKICILQFVFNKLTSKPVVMQEVFGQGDWIRTNDPCIPSAILYQAELHPDKILPTFGAPSRIRTDNLQALDLLPLTNWATGAIWYA